MSDPYEDFADDVESRGVLCCACAEWVYVTSAEYDDLEQEWICDSCLYGNEDDEDEELAVEPAS